MRSGTASRSVEIAGEHMTRLLTEAQRHDSHPARIRMPRLAMLLSLTVDGLSLLHLARHDLTATRNRPKS
jgi:hypothetical protein